MSSDVPLVSVIAPNYNHAPFLNERLGSILRQTFQNFELIILDDASNDDSLSVIRAALADMPYRLITNAGNSGSPCSQWLKGIAEAHGTYIWLAESDDSCTDTFLEILLTTLEQGVRLAYCRTTAIDEASKAIPGSMFWPDVFDAQQWQQSFTMDGSSFCQHYMVQANCIPNASSVLFQKPTKGDIDNLKKLTSGKRYTGDWIFWHYLLTASPCQIHFENRAICYFRTHSGTTRSTTSKLLEKERFQEYSAAIRYCYSSSNPEKGPSPDWLSIAASGGWDWIIGEYWNRYRPSLREKFLISVMHGPLLWGVYIRLLTSQSVLSSYLGLDRLIQLDTLSARVKHQLRGILRPHKK